MACICAASNGICTAMPRHRSTRQRLGVRQSSAALRGRENLSTPPVTKENPVHGRWRDVFPSLQDVRRAGKKRRRATALQDAARGSGGSGERGSVLECGSPLPLWGGCKNVCASPLIEEALVHDRLRHIYSATVRFPVCGQKRWRTAALGRTNFCNQRSHHHRLTTPHPTHIHPPRKSCPS